MKLKTEELIVLRNIINEKLRRHFCYHPKYNQPTIQKHLQERTLINLRFKIEKKLYKDKNRGSKNFD